MKRVSHFFMSAVLAVVAVFLPAAAGAADVLMPRWGKETVTVSEELTFYDYNGTGNIQSSNSSNSLATIVFKPAEAGKAIQITFEEFDVESDYGSYPGYVNVYNGEVDPENTFVYPETTSGVTSSSVLPDGEVLEKLDGFYTDKTYVSTAADGSLSVGFIYRYAKACSGWVAKVKAITVADMEVTGAGASYEGISVSPAGRQSVGLAGFYVDAAGILNPDKLTSVSFTVPVNENVIDPSGLKLFAGSGSDFSKAAPIETVLTEASGVYTLTLSEPLKDGRNAFTIAGDIAADAAFGSDVQVSVQSVGTAAQSGGVTGFVAAAPVTVTVPYMVLMGATPETYSIGENEVLFFDDGGKDGKISSKYEGTVTFVPTTPGKVVQIDFTSVGLYEAMFGSDTYNDVLKVYDGTTADAGNLSGQVFNGKPQRFRSSAADGSLTVYLKSVTGESSIGQGFEAVVSEYLPAPMTVTGIETAQVEGNVCAGDAGQAILSVKISTENTIALTAETLKFTADGTTDLSHLSKAAVYYTGKSGEFSTAVKFGETVPAGQQAFSVSGQQTLVEGDNYFWLAYDIDPHAQNGETFDGGCTEAVLSGAAHQVVSANPDGNRPVKNELLSAVGTVEKTVYGSLEFRNTPNPLSYYDGYEPVEGDQETIFLPGTDGMVIELDIQSFALYYSTSSWAPQAKFEVYSGKGTSGDLLWSLNSDADKNVGPGRILRSSSADGALTVVFNANTTSSSYTAKGWTAEVREYLSKPMSVTSVSATQASVEVLTKGMKNEEILGVNVQTEGNLEALQLKSLSFGLKGSQAGIDKVYVYSSGVKNEVNKETLVGESAVSLGQDDITVVFAEPAELLEGNNYFWLACDVKDDAAAETVVDASLKSAVIGTETLPVAEEAGDPEGERVVRNIYSLRSGDNGEIAVGGETLVFYDEGGADGQTSKNFEGFVTFAPEEAGKAIKLTFKKFDISGNDTFAVDFGGEVKSTHDYKFSYYSKPEAPIVATGDDGKFTVYFKVPSYGSESDGWEIEVSQYQLEPLSVASVEVEAVASGSALKGASDLVMLRADVEVAGDKGNLPFSGFGVSTGGTTAGALSAVSVYATGTSDMFAAVDLIGRAEEQFDAIAADYAVTAPGTYRFWIACNVSQTAVPGDRIEANLVSLTAGGAEYVPAEQVTAALSVKKGKSGVYTVGEGGDYATVQSAVDDIATGIEGPVVINVKSGSYNELVTVPEIPGASETNTVTLQSESGNYGDVTIYHNRYTAPPYSDDQMADEYGVFTFSGADYFTIKDLTLTTSDLKFPSVVHVRDRSRHCTVDHCHVYSERSESVSDTDINLIYQYAKNEENCNNDFFTVRNSLIEGGYIGLRIAGTSFVALPKQKGCVVENNTFRNQGTKSFYSASREIDLTVRGNVFENKDAQKAGFQAIDLQTSEGLLIEGNSFDIDLPNYATAINLRQADGTAEKRGRIVNNEIAISSPSATATAGIKVNSPSTCLDIAYNTVLVTGAENTAGGVALYVNDQMTDMTVCNNIFQVKDGGFVYRFYKEANCESGIVFSNNAVFTNGGSFAKTSGSTTEDSYDAWLQKSGETGSVNEEVQFLSSSILFPAEEGGLRNAMPLDYVATDKDGAARDSSAPTIGAYEYDECADVPAYADGYPVIGNITHVSAGAVLKPTGSCVAFLLVRPTEEPAPSADEMMASEWMQELRGGKETALELTGLVRQTEYKLYSLLMSLNGLGISDVLESEPFITSFTPTSVSTFENAVYGDAGFEDGTAAFEGFTVEETDDAVVEGTKITKIGENAKITLTNTDRGLVLTGFFLKSDAGVTMRVCDGNGETQSYALASTAGEWVFCNLKDKGAVTSVEMTAEGNAFIDNFSGEPLGFHTEVVSGEVNAEEGGTATLSALSAGGVPPYSYSWKDAMRNEVGTAAICQTPELRHSGVYTVTATDAWGHTAEGRMLVYVAGQAAVATFDDNFLESESYYNGEGEDDSDWTSPGIDSKFFSGSYSFDNNRHTSTWWGGFAVSNQTSADFVSFADQFKSAAGGGHRSANYGVGYSFDGAAYSIGLSHNREEGDGITGFYVTNAAYAADAIANGDGMASVPGGFAEGDYFKLIVSGEKADGSVATLDYYLADYRSENAAEHYSLDTWQWVDLRRLGKVKKVSFSFEGTKKNQFGLTTPTYFCLDDFGGEREIEDAPQQLAGTSVAADIDLTQFFIPEEDGSSVTFRIEDACDAESAEMTVDGDVLHVTGLKDLTTVETVVSATQRGRISFVRIPVLIDEARAGAEMTEMDNVSVYPVPATDRLHIRTDMSGYSVEVFTAGGACVMKEDGKDGNISIPVSHLAEGVYILTLRNGSRTVKKRFIVK